MKFAATINTPGYLPQDDTDHVFDTPGEAWEFLRDVRERDLDDPMNDEDDDGDECLDEIEGFIDHPETGTVYGFTPGRTDEHDLGLAYSVSLVHADYPHEPGRLYDCEACESQCHCTGDPGHTQCVFCGIQAEGEFSIMSESALSDN
jgi:hypothetical protein